MPCYTPWPAWETDDGNIVLFPRTGQKIRREITLPCYNCIGCRLERSRQWAIRCMHEAATNRYNCFITLTYEDKHVPKDMSLNYKDWQLFIRYLRRSIKKTPELYLGDKVRFYMCGEYGETFTRPHFHACIFGIEFADKTPIRLLDSSNTLFRSATLEKLWTKGFSTIGELTFQSAAYVARYVTDKLTPQERAQHTYINDDGEIHMRRPEFNKMSLKPGIGAEWLKQFHKDVYPSDEVITNGYAGRVPRYYDTIYERDLKGDLTEIKAQRELTQYGFRADNTTPRLKAKEKVTQARLNHKLKRKLA